MIDPTSDDDLHALYARQRAADQERAPSFPAMRAGALEDSSITRSSRPLIPLWAWPLSAAVAVLLGIVAFLAIPRPPTPRPLTSHDDAVRQIAQIDAALQKNLAAHESIAAWRSPTDFLLKPIITETP